MKLTNFQMDATLYGGEIDVEVVRLEWRPDSMNRTLFANITTNVEVGANGGLVEIRQGDRIFLRIPSGYWEGTVRSISLDEYVQPLLQLERCEWHGRWAGLENGRSGLFSWSVHGSGTSVVETSAFHDPVPLWVYEQAHQVANLGPESFSDRDNRREALRQVIQLVQSWHGGTFEGATIGGSLEPFSSKEKVEESRPATEEEPAERRITIGDFVGDLFEKGGGEANE